MWSAAAACLPHVSEHTPTTMTVLTAATASLSLLARPGLPAQSILKYIIPVRGRLSVRGRLYWFVAVYLINFQTAANRPSVRRGEQDAEMNKGGESWAGMRHRTRRQLRARGTSAQILKSPT